MDPRRIPSIKFVSPKTKQKDFLQENGQRVCNSCTKHTNQNQYLLNNDAEKVQQCIELKSHANFKQNYKFRAEVQKQEQHIKPERNFCENNNFKANNRTAYNGTVMVRHQEVQTDKIMDQEYLQQALEECVAMRSSKAAAKKRNANSESLAYEYKHKIDPSIGSCEQRKLGNDYRWINQKPGDGTINLVDQFDAGEKNMFSQDVLFRKSVASPKCHKYCSFNGYSDGRDSIETMGACRHNHDEEADSFNLEDPQCLYNESKEEIDYYNRSSIRKRQLHGTLNLFADERNIPSPNNITRKTAPSTSCRNKCSNFSDQNSIEPVSEQNRYMKQRVLGGMNNAQHSQRMRRTTSMTGEMVPNRKSNQMNNNWRSIRNQHETGTLNLFSQYAEHGETSLLPDTISCPFSRSAKSCRARHSPSNSSDLVAECPSDHILLPERDRIHMLSRLQKNHRALIQELNFMPMSKDTMNIRNRKKEIELELIEIDRQIRKYSEPRVYIKI